MIKVNAKHLQDAINEMVKQHDIPVVNKAFEKSLRIQTRKFRKEFSRAASKITGVKAKDVQKRLIVTNSRRKSQMFTSPKYQHFVVFPNFRLRSKSALTSRPKGGVSFAGAHGHKYKNPQGFYSPKRDQFFERKVVGGKRVDKGPIGVLTTEKNLGDVYKAKIVGPMVDAATLKIIKGTYAILNRPSGRR